MFQLVKTLKKVKGALKLRNKQHYTNIEMQAHLRKEHMMDIQRKLDWDPSNSELAHLESQVALNFKCKNDDLMKFLQQKWVEIEHECF